LKGKDKKPSKTASTLPHKLSTSSEVDETNGNYGFRPSGLDTSMLSEKQVLERFERMLVS
jgi:hypothetical protein